MNKYTKRRDEEEQCWQCGYPLGDTAYETADDVMLCSKQCGEVVERNKQWRQAQVDCVTATYYVHKGAM